MTKVNDEQAQVILIAVNKIVSGLHDAIRFEGKIAGGRGLLVLEEGKKELQELGVPFE